VQNARGLVRQLLTESLLLATIGGALAIWGTSALSTAAAGMLLPTQRLTIDLPVLGFACAASLLAGLAFDLVPALHDGAFQSSISFAQTFARDSVPTGLAVTRNWWVHGLSNGASEIRDPLPCLYLTNGLGRVH
jgi:hypothetical protein